jgi:hypothetical protein
MATHVFSDDDASPFDSKVSPRVRTLLPIVALIVAASFAYWPLLAGQIVLHRDSALWVFRLAGLCDRHCFPGNPPRGTHTKASDSQFSRILSTPSSTHCIGCFC